MVVTVVRVGVEVTVDLWTEMVLVVGDLGKVVGIVVVVETGQFIVHELAGTAGVVLAVTDKGVLEVEVCRAFCVSRPLFVDVLRVAGDVDCEEFWVEIQLMAFVEVFCEVITDVGEVECLLMTFVAMRGMATAAVTSRATKTPQIILDCLELRRRPPLSTACIRPWTLSLSEGAADGNVSLESARSS